MPTLTKTMHLWLSLTVLLPTILPVTYYLPDLIAILMYKKDRAQAAFQFQCSFKKI
jgi:hypothetical protein